MQYSSDLYRVGGEKQLLIDEAFFDESRNIHLLMHPALKTDEKLLSSEHPWEDSTINWFSIMEDQGIVDRQAKYRLWYECYDVQSNPERPAGQWPTRAQWDDLSFCYAESRDGLRWTKPELGLCEFRGSRRNNIIFREIGPEQCHSRVHGVGIFKDPKAPPESRYKAISQGLWWDKNGEFPGTEAIHYAGMCSADGLNWTRLPTPIHAELADSQNSCFWDPNRGKYVLYNRGNGWESDDFSWFETKVGSFSPDAAALAKSIVYNPAVMLYPYAANVYLALPSLYPRPSDVPDSPDTLDIHLAVSRDGARWTWPGSPIPFIGLGKAGTFDSGSLYMGQGMIRSGQTLWLYYSGSPRTHGQGGTSYAVLHPEQRRIFSRVTVPVDRLVSADAHSEGGHFVTPPLSFEGRCLDLDLTVREGGSVRVGLLTEGHQPVPDHTVADCLPITGDSRAKRVCWQTSHDVAICSGKPVRLHVELWNAGLYGFRFGEE